MKRPALWSLVFLIMGIFLGRYGFGSLCTVLFSVVSVVCALRTVKSAKLMAMLAVFSVLGFGLMVNAVNFGTENLNASAENGEDIRIKGIVKDKDVSARGYDRITLKLLSAENGEGRLIFDGEKNVNILIYTQYGEEIQYGSEAEAYVNLESLEGPENYGGFDSMVYNGARGIDYSFCAEDISFMPG